MQQWSAVFRGGMGEEGGEDHSINMLIYNNIILISTADDIRVMLATSVTAKLKASVRY